MSRRFSSLNNFLTAGSGNLPRPFPSPPLGISAALKRRFSVKGKIKVKGKVGAGFKPAPTETENRKQ
jgi:hypothetical protein